MTDLQQVYLACAIDVVIIAGLAVALVRKARQQKGRL